MKKKIMILVLIVVLALAGCQKAPVATPSPTMAAPTPTATIAPTEAPPPTPTPIPEPVSETYYQDGVIKAKDGINPNTGLPMQGQFKPIAMMIENTAAARPQSGITMADIVYEVIMEGGGVSRCMGIFSDSLPEKAGPVRSSRIPFLQILTPFKQVAYTHFGGCEAAGYNVYERFPSMGFSVRVDGLSDHSNLFWRDDARVAPHNAYINLNDVNKLITNEAPREARFVIDSTKQPGGEDAQKASFTYFGSYKVGYEYDPQTKLYTRTIGGKPMVDKEGDKKAVQVSNVIVQYTDYAFNSQIVGLVTLGIVGSGKADFFVGGKHIQGTWERKDEKSLTLYYDQDGNMMSFLPGKTWIDVPKTNTAVTIG